MKFKKFIDIERLKDKYATAFTKGEHIVISEKLDGANVSIRFDDNENIIACSRRQFLSKDNTLQGFYNYVQNLNAKAIYNIIGTRYIIFGEFLVKHSISYPEDKYKEFYVFDIWDTIKEQYMPWSIVAAAAKKLNFKTVPIFYDGEFTSWEDIYSFVGKTKMGGFSMWRRYSS